MQYRHLSYFVKIVETGSFSRAAATIHVAQPALSHQIADLEERLGCCAVAPERARVRPTPAGEVLYREASAILRQMEKLRGVVRSAGGEAEGTVSLGLAASLTALVGPFIETCRSAHPKVTLKFSDSDSESLEARIEANANRISPWCFEPEFVSHYSRKPLFRQRLFFHQRQADVPRRDFRVSRTDRRLSSHPAGTPQRPAWSDRSCLRCRRSFTECHRRG